MLHQQLKADVPSRLKARTKISPDEYDKTMQWVSQLYLGLIGSNHNEMKSTLTKTKTKTDFDLILF